MTFFINEIKFYISFYFLLIMSLLFFLNNNIYLISYLFFIFIHEISHIYMMIIYNNYIKEISLLPFGVKILKKQNFNNSYIKDVFILSAGIFSNLLFFLLFKFLQKIYINEMFIIFANINLTLVIFNILPISVLDGGQILEILFLNKFGYKGIKIYKIFSILLSIFLLFFSVYVFIFYNISITLVITSIYLLITSII